MTLTDRHRRALAAPRIAALSTDETAASELTPDQLSQISGGYVPPEGEHWEDDKKHPIPLPMYP